MANFISHFAVGKIFHNLSGLFHMAQAIFHHIQRPTLIFHRFYAILHIGGDGVKKLFSLFSFFLIFAIFVFDMYWGIAGAINVNNHLAELEARDASGHEILGVGLDILVLGVIFVSIIGCTISLVSWKIAQRKVIRISSAVMCPCFLIPIFICAIILII